MSAETALDRLVKCQAHGWAATLRRDQCAEIARRRTFFVGLGMSEAVWQRIERAFLHRIGARLSVDEVKAVRLWETV